jgi:hypothetical protein
VFTLSCFLFNHLANLACCSTDSDCPMTGAWEAKLGAMFDVFSLRLQIEREIVIIKDFDNFGRKVQISESIKENIKRWTRVCFLAAEKDDDMEDMR